MTPTDVQPADAALLRECAVMHDQLARHWSEGVPANEETAKSMADCLTHYSTRAARLRALADQMERGEVSVEDRKGHAMYCQRCYCELPNHSKSCARLNEIESLSPEMIEAAATVMAAARGWKWDEVDSELRGQYMSTARSALIAALACLPASDQRPRGSLNDVQGVGR